ncbi:MAG: hypothetical protein GSR84_01960 [Desulfurococcales archaeon]|nr:hypothetical protein [Desulfurococcales archaeon]
MEDLVDRMRRAMGLTLYEAKLYLAMLRGASNPREASASSGVPLPRIYDVIRALEAKGLVEPEPGGWYRPRTPRAVAAAMLAKLEEEARRRSAEILSIADLLEAEARVAVQGAPIVGIQGAYNIVSAIAEAAVEAPGLYILAGPQLYSRPGILVSIARGTAGVCPRVRILLGSEARGLVDSLEATGAEVKVTRFDPVSMASTPEALVLVVEDSSREDLSGIVVRDPGQAGHAYRALDGLWDSLG